MNKNRSIIFTILASLIINASACVDGPTSSKNAHVAPVAPPDTVNASISGLPLEEQQKKAFELFQKILETSRSIERPDGLGQLEELYSQLIDTCPDTPLAHESYKLLITMQLESYSPPKKDDALILYREYIIKYPNSPLKEFIVDSIIRFLSRNKHWEDLSAVTSPLVKSDAPPKRLRKSFLLFLYAEANFHINNFQEALWGYRRNSKTIP